MRQVVHHATTVATHFDAQLFQENERVIKRESLQKIDSLWTVQRISFSSKSYR